MIGPFCLVHIGCQTWVTSVEFGRSLLAMLSVE